MRETFLSLSSNCKIVCTRCVDREVVITSFGDRIEATEWLRRFFNDDGVWNTALEEILFKIPEGKNFIEVLDVPGYTPITFSFIFKE